MILPGPVTAQPMRDYYNSANEKSLHFKLFSFLQCTLHLQQPLPSPRTVVPNLFLWTCAWCVIRPYVSNCSSSLFLNELILLEKYLALCLRSTVFMVIKVTTDTLDGGTALRANSLGRAVVICKLVDGLLSVFQKALTPLLDASALAQRESLISLIALIKAPHSFIGD